MVAASAGQIAWTAEIGNGQADVNRMAKEQGLNLEFVDEALNLVRDAEAQGIRLRILGSIAYRLQCPNNLHLFQDTKRVLTDVDFGAEKKQNKAIREFLVARGYMPDEGAGTHFTQAPSIRHSVAGIIRSGFP